MRKHNLDPVRSALNLLVSNALNASAQSVVQQAINSPQEPDFIASLAVDFSPVLFKILSGAFPSHLFSVTGVFVHQSPIVTFGANHSCELGDLLLVYTYTDIHRKTRYNALLLQAKMTNDLELRLSAGDPQFLLYSEWPPFLCKKGLPGISKQNFDINPKLTTLGAQYLMIDDHPIFGYGKLQGTFAFGTGHAYRKVRVEEEFSKELLNLIAFQTGRPFEADLNTTNDDWTRLIWALLTSTKSAVSRRKNIGLTSKNGAKSLPRRTISQTNSPGSRTSILGSFGSLGSGGDGENTGQISPPDEESGLSVILIECSEQQE